MALCPHCGREVEFAPTRVTTLWQRNLTPGLGCGSLIAIAIIVIIFSRGHSGDIERSSGEVRALERKVDDLTMSVNVLSKKPKD